MSVYSVFANMPTEVLMPQLSLLELLRNLRPLSKLGANLSPAADSMKGSISVHAIFSWTKCRLKPMQNILH